MASFVSLIRWITQLREESLAYKALRSSEFENILQLRHRYYLLYIYTKINAGAEGLHSNHKENLDP